MRRGQVVAQLDPGLYQQQVRVQASRVELAQAELQRQQAGFRSEEIAAAQAGVSEAQARLTRAQADYDRSQQLFAAGVVARSELDAQQSELDQARSAVQARQSQLSLLQAGTRREDIAIYESALARGAGRTGPGAVQRHVLHDSAPRPTGWSTSSWLSPGTGWRPAPAS